VCPREITESRGKALQKESREWMRHVSMAGSVQRKEVIIGNGPCWNFLVFFFGEIWVMLPLREGL